MSEGCTVTMPVMVPERSLNNRIISREVYDKAMSEAVQRKAPVVFVDDRQSRLSIDFTTVVGCVEAYDKETNTTTLNIASGPVKNMLKDCGAYFSVRPTIIGEQEGKQFKNIKISDFSLELKGGT